MPDLSQDVQSVAGLLTQSGDVATEADNTFRQALKQADELGKRILAGETTGDRIMDYVIVRHHLPNEKIAATYRNLEALLQQHVGELVLVVSREEHSAISSTFAREPDNDDYVIEEYLQLGVIKEGRFFIELAYVRCAISVDGAFFTLSPHDENPRKWEQNHLSPRHWVFGCFGQPLDCKNPANRKRGAGPLMLEIVVGDAEVAQWFATCPLRLQMAFRTAARLLGHPVAATPEIMAELERRRQDLTEKLLKSVLERHQLRSQGGYTKQGFSLDQVEQLLKEQLALAVEFGMIDHQLFSVRALCQEYGVKTE